MGSIKDLEKRLIEFVNEYSDLYAVYIGKAVEVENPEDEKVVCYYLLTKGDFDWDRSDRLGGILLEADVNLRDFFVQEWPCLPEDIGQYGFLEKCIYRKQ